VPIYEYKCYKGHYFTRYLALADYKEPQTCECGEKSIKLLSKPMIAPTFEAYESPITGKPITTKQQRIEDLKRSGCVPYESGMVEEGNRRLAAEEYKLEKALDETVDEQIEKMSPRQHEKLEESLKSGVEVEYGRN